MVFQARAAWPAARLRNAVQGRSRRERGLRPARATITSCSGIFTISCSIRAAPRAGTPIRWAALYPYADVMPPLPAVRPRWPGKAIDLRQLCLTRATQRFAAATLLRERHSTRNFDDKRSDHAYRACALSRQYRASPVAVARTAPISATGAVRWWSTPCGPIRPAGSSYELELYLDRRQLRRACIAASIITTPTARTRPDRRPAAGARSAAARRRNSRWMRRPLRRS